VLRESEPTSESENSNCISLESLYDRNDISEVVVLSDNMGSDYSRLVPCPSEPFVYCWLERIQWVPYNSPSEVKIFRIANGSIVPYDLWQMDPISGVGKAERLQLKLSCRQQNRYILWANQKSEHFLLYMYSRYCNLPYIGTGKSSTSTGGWVVVINFD
jgi:hypothetical protein